MVFLEAHNYKYLCGGAVSMSLKQYDDRMKICRECPELQRKLTGSYCNICGCNMKLKTQLPLASCPLNKW